MSTSDLQLEGARRWAALETARAERWRRRAEETLSELHEAHMLIVRLHQLVIEHHAAGAMEPLLIGEQCPVCKEFTENLP
jgi:hypothetical protein